MATIVPAILESDPARYKALIESYNTFAKRVQIDISDGEFAPTKTLPETQTYWPKQWQVDMHMMVIQPSAHLDTLLKLQPSLVIFHAETQEDLLPLFATLKKSGIKTGVAILKHTFPGSIKPILDVVDHALIFGGDLGKQGAVADLLLLEKVHIIRNLKPDLEIGWDGGATIQNIRTIAQSGLDVINVGSALATAPDPAATMKALEEESEKPGVAI
jgi:ribulose-phosphate 3-epimerase